MEKIKVKKGNVVREGQMGIEEVVAKDVQPSHRKNLPGPVQGVVEELPVSDQKWNDAGIYYGDRI